MNPETGLRVGAETLRGIGAWAGEGHEANRTGTPGPESCVCISGPVSLHVPLDSCPPAATPDLGEGRWAAALPAREPTGVGASEPTGLPRTRCTESTGGREGPSHSTVPAPASGAQPAPAPLLCFCPAVLEVSESSVNWVVVLGLNEKMTVRRFEKA